MHREEIIIAHMKTAQKTIETPDLKTDDKPIIENGLIKEDIPGDNIDFRIEIKYIVILVILGIIVYFFQLGAMTLWDTDEALYTEIAREMSVTGDYLTTQWNYTPWFCHPPLYFWLTTLSAKIMGWTEFAARFPSALFGLLLVILTYYLGRLLVNARAGFFAGLITITTIQLWIQARMALLDMPFLFFLTAAVYFFILGIKKKNRYYYIGFWACAGFAVLTKGPVGFILPAIYVFFYILITGKWKEIVPLIFSWGAPIFLLLSIPWYWAMANIYGNPFLEQVFGYFFLKRIYTPVMNQDGPWYYYIPVFLAGFLPWTAFIPLTFYFLFRKFSDYRAKFLLAWIVFTFVLFTLAGTKRPNYILFIYPGLSVGLGWALESIFSRNGFRRSSTISFAAFSISTLLVIGAFIFVAVRLYPHYFSQYARNLLLLAVPLLVGGITTLILSFKRKEFAFYGIVIMAAASYLVLISYIPLVQSLKPEPQLTGTILKLQRPGDRLALRGNFGRQFSIIYYSKQPAILYHSDEDLITGLHKQYGLFVVMHNKNFERIRSRISVPYTIIQKKEGLVLFYKGRTPLISDMKNGRRVFLDKIEIQE